MSEVIDIATRRPLVEGGPVAVPEMTAEPLDILNECVKQAASMDEVIVMFKNKEGDFGFISSIEGVAENVLFMELVRLQALNASASGDDGNTFA